MNGFKIGDKAIFIKSDCGNEGKIVEVTSFFNPNHMTWDSDEYDDLCDLIVKSLGAPMNVIGFDNDDVPYHTTEMEGPTPSSYLRKLPDITEDEPYEEYYVAPKLYSN